MTPDEYRFLYELEERHWWFVGMRKVVASLLDGVLPDKRLQILDAGCGTGLMLKWLRRYGRESEVDGLDFDSHAIQYCALRGEKRLVQGSIAAIPWPGEFFDLVITLDVLDSFPADEVPGPCRELARVVKRGGWLLVRVPAFQFLYSQHDRAVHTQHRFTAGELRARLEAQGLRVERLTYANAFLFPVAAIWRWLTRSDTPEPQSDVRPLPRILRWLNPVLAWLLAVEAAWLRYLPWRLPFGLSVIALAHKPEALNGN
jgi:SAM-dependent methyltransferase